MANMKYDDFKTAVMDSIKSFLPDKYMDAKIEIQEVKKNNDITMDGLIIRMPDKNIAPTIYIEELYDSMILENKALSTVLKEIADIQLNNEAPDINVEDIMNLNAMRNKISMRVVSYDENHDQLTNLPYIRLGNLAAIFTENVMSFKNGNGTITIHNNLMKALGVSVEQLHQIAIDNFDKSTVLFDNISNVLSSKIKTKSLNEFEHSPDSEPMYVLTCKSGLYGASMIAYPGIMSEISEKLGGDFYVLPSSVHELIIISKEEIPDYEILEDMVKEVNATEVRDNEILASSVYEYDADSKALYLAFDHSIVISSDFLQENDYEKNNDIQATTSTFLEKVFEKNLDMSNLTPGIEM